MLTDKPEKAVDLLTPREKAVVNPISDIHNKVSKPSIVVFAEDIVDDPNDVEVPDEKLNTKSEPERVDKITFTFEKEKFYCILILQCVNSTGKLQQIYKLNSVRWARSLYGVIF